MGLSSSRTISASCVVMFTSAYAGMPPSRFVNHLNRSAYASGLTRTGAFW